MKKVLLACALLVAIPGCAGFTATGAIGVLGAISTGATASLADFCARPTTSAEARTQAGCDLIEE